MVLQLVILGRKDEEKTVREIREIIAGGAPKAGQSQPRNERKT